MIDTHCHLLFGLDDGPRTLGESVELAWELVAGGVEAVLCTPHFTEMFPTSHAEAGSRLEEVRRELEAEDIQLRLELAAEIGPRFAMRAPLEELVLRSVARRHLVVEVQPETPLAFFEVVSTRIAELGLTAIFAHPERSKAVQRRPGILGEVRETGALVQVVAPSLTGSWGGSAGQTAWGLIASGHADLLGSDAHGPNRPPELAAAAALVAERLGEDIAAWLTVEGPRKVVPTLS